MFVIHEYTNSKKKKNLLTNGKWEENLTSAIANLMLARDKGACATLCLCMTAPRTTTNTIIHST
jgi:hypothetical protein